MPISTTEQLLMTPREAAKALTLSERSLWRLTFEAEAGIPYVKLGRLVRYAVIDVKEWLRANTQRNGDTDSIPAA